ncbi:hypothetical protein [Streptomyces synnematoformans]|uniref:Trp biosynthesis-associated membrane protein n=1 Tax=Streptomyces synnematoformans TaxID=415721 RepID=A0ABN2YPH2_9ACTN
MLPSTASKARYAVGTVLVLVGAVAVVWSVWRPWYNGRDGRYYQLGDVFDGISNTRAQLFGSLFLAMAAAAFLALLGILRRSRLLVVLAGLLVLFITGLWMFRQGQAVDGLKVNTDGTGLDVGAANAVIGAALMLIGAGVWGNQRRRRAIPHPEQEAPDQLAARRRSALPTSTGPGPGPRQGADTPADTPADRPQEPPRAA